MVPALLGPLVAVECQRALRRSRLGLWRVVAALPALAIGLFAAWYWRLSTRFDPAYMPNEFLPGSLIAVEVVSLALALLLTPAMMAATLAGEKTRGTLALLLTSHVSSREIVVARLAGRLLMIVMLLAACLPMLAWLGANCSIPATHLLVLAALPIAVAFGAGGLSLWVSSWANRGRDALIVVLALDLALAIIPTMGLSWLPPAFRDWLEPLNPFAGLAELAWGAQASFTVRSILVWCLIGVLGLELAARRVSVRLLHETPPRVARIRFWRSRRRAAVPAEQPMLWKELRVEQSVSFSPILRWLQGLFILVLTVAGGLLLVGALLARILDRTVDEPDSWMFYLGYSVRETSVVLNWLVQWSIGLRAASAIPTEREQSTWDNLLTTPLEGREIVWGKLFGSAYSMRWLLAASWFAWTSCALTQQMSWEEWLGLLASALGMGAWMTAIGVWASLISPNATRASVISMASWLAGSLAFSLLAAILAASAALVIAIALLTSGNRLGGGSWFAAGYGTLRLLISLSCAALVASYCARNFDRLAGRAAAVWGIPVMTPTARNLGVQAAADPRPIAKK